MTTRAFLLASLLLGFNAFALRQDPLKVAPEAYKLQFENDWVKVTRVYYGPRARVPMHDHSRLPAAYVYLNDSGPINFSHAGWEHPVLTRRPTKAGAFRLSPTAAVGETHEVENPTDIPSDFLRIEFKTRADGRASLHGRFYPVRYRAGSYFRKVQFANEQLRVTRLACPPRKTLTVEASASEPALLVILSRARLGAAGRETLEAGQTVWLEGGDEMQFGNLSDTPLELLRFDFRTDPVKSAAGGE
ncbi:MAG TPA: hypothetical protein VM914_04815 [Pyrinomonadaceae bacterium]|jgi:quercetin dioxygenase-like cupin family protein|nr:hypothetical protein [Pyrinomonadaceae bacterium]